MRLLDTSTLEVKLFIQRQVPEYAILSHTWEEEEVTLQDMESGMARQKKGFAKIERCCQKAAEDGYSYCWVDTCCIDKESSSELSEAINSMYQWYRDSNICYAYLADLKTPSLEGFRRSKWFTRGWTLQELIAPLVVEFYSADWTEYGTRLSLQAQIAEITNIIPAVLQGGDPSRYTVATRMSWAANRTTTRLEDEAYCLLGLFRINMPLLYGEGSRAFRRLQETIMREEEDYTLLTWTSARLNSFLSGGLLAHSPSDFTTLMLRSPEDAIIHCNYEKLSRKPLPLLAPSAAGTVPVSLTNRGLHISLPIMTSSISGGIIACLTTIPSSEAGVHLVCVHLYPQGIQGCFVRRGKESLWILPAEQGAAFQLKTIYVEQPSAFPTPRTLLDIGNSPQDLFLVFIRTSGDADAQYSLASPETNISVQQFLELRKQDLNLLDDEARATADTITQRAVKLHNVPDATLQEMASGDPSSCILFDDDMRSMWSKPAILECMIKGEPSNKFRIVLELKSGSPRFYLRSIDNPLWEGMDKSGSVFRIEYDKTYTGPLTRTYIWRTIESYDRVTVQTVSEFGKISIPFREMHRFSISLRRISSTPGAINIPRLVLSVEYRKVALERTGFERIS